MYNEEDLQDNWCPGSLPIADGSSDADSGKKLCGDPVVPRSDASVVLQAAEQALNNITRSSLCLHWGTTTLPPWRSTPNVLSGPGRAYLHLGREHKSEAGYVETE